MIGELKPYPAMKDSGVEWLGEVPEHWEVTRLSRVVHSTNAGEVIDKGWWNKGNEVLYTCAKSALISDYDSFPKKKRTTGRDLLLTRNGTPYVHRPVPDGIYSNVVQRINLRDGSDREWIARSLEASTKSMKGYGVSIESLNYDMWKVLAVLLPPLHEQAAIVRYLDHVDRRVRRLTRAKRKLIALLTEQKQAIIHRAVTRGLDPDVPLKDSGVEWLGEVPEHWEVRRNGRLFAQRNETGFADLPILEVSLRTGIRIRDFETSARKQVMSDRDKYKRARTGDIAYNTMRMWQGAVGIAPTDGLISPAYVIARPLPGTVSRYFEMLFRTSVYMQEVDNYSRGIVKDRNRLYWEDFKAMPSCYPPPSEQSAIVDHLDQATADIEATISRAEREIELLGEYRTRLIADVVTGKFDVRDAAAALPEVDPLAEDDHADELDAGLDIDADELDETPEEAEA